MLDILAVILPVFLVVGAGFLAVWRGLLNDDHIDGLNSFAQKAAIPCLLFSAIATLDLGAEFNWRLMSSYYAGSSICFVVGLLGARVFFKRPWPDAVAIAFAAMFANTVLLGLQVSERAYGAEALAPNFAIISIHAAFCYLLGIIAMEIARATGSGPLALSKSVLRAIFGNALMIGIALGFVVNFSGLPVPSVIGDAVGLMVQAALPAALFGLGGVLYRYRPEGDALTILFICAISLILHPAIVMGLQAGGMGLSVDQLRAAVLTAAMAPGANAYLFAHQYNVAKRVAASSVLIGTALCVVTATVWIAVLP